MRWLLAVAAAGAATWTGCGGNEPRAAAGASPAAVVVQAAAARAEEWPEVYEATGTVRARTSTVLSSKLMAYVQRVTVEVGDQVREGQEMATLEARDLESGVRRAEVAESEVLSAFAEADNGIAAAKANLDLARSTFERMQQLAAKKSISSQEFDEASARLKGAEAAHEMARARRRQLDAKLAQAQQEVRGARVQLDYTHIVAPFAGVVTAKTAEAGTLASPGMPLVTLEREGAYRLEAQVDEGKLGLVKAGESVEVELEPLNRKLTARVSEVVPAVDAASRAYTVKIDLPAMANLRSGLYGRALFGMGKRRVVPVPVQAVVEHGQLQSVFVVEGGVAHSRLVSTGRRNGTAVEILSGVSEGEIIVSPVNAAVHDGARAEVRQ